MRTFNLIACLTIFVIVSAVLPVSGATNNLHDGFVGSIWNSDSWWRGSANVQLGGGGQVTASGQEATVVSVTPFKFTPGAYFEINVNEISAPVSYEYSSVGISSIKCLDEYRLYAGESGGYMLMDKIDDPANNFTIWKSTGGESYTPRTRSYYKVRIANVGGNFTVYVDQGSGLVQVFQEAYTFPDDVYFFFQNIDRVSTSYSNFVYHGPDLADYQSKPTPFYKNRDCAAVYGFDDGIMSAWTSLSNVWNNHPEYKGSYFIIANFIGSNTYMTWPTVQSILDHGHDVGNHTFNHDNLQSLSPAQQITTISNCKYQLETHLTGYTNIFRNNEVVYPYCSYNATVWDAVHLLYPYGSGYECSEARHLYSSTFAERPLYYIGRVGQDITTDPGSDAANANSLVSNASLEHRTFILYSHTMSVADAVQWDLHFDWLEAHTNIWAGMTHSALINYLYTRDDTGVKTVSSGANTATMIATNANRYPVKEITIMTKVPASWSTVTVQQTGRPDQNPVVNMNGFYSVIVYNVTPNVNYVITSGSIPTGIKTTNVLVTPSVASNNKNTGVVFTLKAVSQSGSITNVSINLSQVGGPALMKMTNISGWTSFRYSYTVPLGLAEGIKTIQIIVWDNSGNSDSTKSFSLMVVATNQIIPTPYTPVGYTNNANPNYVWSQKSGVTRYWIEVRTNNVAGKVIASNMNVNPSTTTNTLLSGLNNGQYFWRVKALKTATGTWQNWSAGVAFIVDTVNPAMTTLVMPIGGSITNNNGPVFGWNPSSDLNGISSYQLMLSNTGTGIKILTNLGLATAFTPASLLADGTYAWKVRAFDPAHNAGAYSIQWTIQIETVPPSSPGWIRAVPVSTNQINLSWHDLPNETSYTLFRNISNSTTTGAFFVKVGGTTANVTNYGDLALSANSKYFYWLKAYNICGGSPFSVVISNMTCPSPPQWVGSAVVSTNKINLSWKVLANVTSYSLFRNTLNMTNGAVKVSGTAANNTNYSDTGLMSGTTYYYWLKAYNGFGGSAFSPLSISVTTLTNPKPAYSKAGLYPTCFDLSKDRTVNVYCGGGAGNVTAKAYDLSGYLVKDFGTRNGTDVFTWDGKGDSGAILQSGVYVIRFSGTGFEKIVKFMVVK